MLVINASPYEQGKHRVRYDLCRSRAAETGCTVAYVNLVGGQDELVFDGQSLVVAPDGEVLARAPQFVEHVLVVDLDLPEGCDRGRPGPALRPGHPGRRATGPSPTAGCGPCRSTPLEDCEEVYRALVLGLRDYARKNGFTDVVLGLSGGIDSALVATLAVDALGAEHVHTVAMPSRYSSAHSLADAADLAARQGTRHRVVPVQPMVDAFVGGLGLDRAGRGERPGAGARRRRSWASATARASWCWRPGNKSELATGYSTIYGDAVGGFGPIKDVPKTLVWALARWRNADAESRGEQPPIPASSIEKPPSAELAPGPGRLRLPARLRAARRRRRRLRGRRPRPRRAGGPRRRATRWSTTSSASWTARSGSAASTRWAPRSAGKAFGRDRRLPVTSRWVEPAAR